jgi:hypothetical protein
MEVYMQRVAISTEEKVAVIGIVIFAVIGWCMFYFNDATTWHHWVAWANHWHL